MRPLDNCWFKEKLLGGYFSLISLFQTNDYCPECEPHSYHQMLRTK